MVMVRVTTWVRIACHQPCYQTQIPAADGKIVTLTEQRLVALGLRALIPAVSRRSFETRGLMSLVLCVLT